MTISLRAKRRFRARLAAGVTLLLALGASVPLAAAASPEAATATAPPVESEADSEEQVVDDAVIPEAERDATLGDGWQASEDIAWTTVGDSEGFRILVARMSTGYRWEQIATLGAEGFDTDRWIGNACMTSDQHWLAVTYAPRTFTNDEALFARGGFAAFVNVDTGEVTPIAEGFSLAYFNPGCGEGDQVALTQYSDDGQSRISRFSASNPTEPVIVEVDQTVTSIVPTADGLNGIIGRSIVEIDGAGEASTVLEADGLASDLTIAADGGIAYLQHDGEYSQAMFVENSDATPIELASGPLGDVGVSRDAAGGIYVTGDPEATTSEVPHEVEVVPGTATRSSPSSTGELILAQRALLTDQGEAAQVPEDADADAAAAATIQATARATDTDVSFTVPIESTAATSGGFDGSSEQQRGVTSENANSPISVGSVCSVPRNDPAIQALQPRPAELEWAVNQGIRQTLHSSFPLPALSGGGRVPAQIMLGILAQESNFWQASKYVVPGVTGNPLVGNYYGINRDSSSANAWWQINYPKADCGYGVAQVTTGMEVGEMPYSQQLAIATDYKANIARGLQILIEKWNETRAVGLTINDGNPKYMENWFYALWTYNTGFKEVNAGGRWGVGWLNNPINQIYPANRAPFLDGRPEDAAHPQDWPYPEKVLGFAAHSVQFLDSVSSTGLGDKFNYVPAFTPAWWTGSDGHMGVQNRENVKPPIDLFCNATNECNPANIASPCTRADYECWFHSPATWKADCPSQCGYEDLSYSLGAPKPAGANSFPSNCTRNDLPGGALIVDSVPPGTQPVRGGCSPVQTTGSFSFTFPAGASGKYPGKIDVHQLGSGFNGQFYFSHTRVPGTDQAFNGALDFSGTWSLGEPLHRWAQVYVHMPSHGAWLQQAKYTINTGLTTVTRSVNQRNYANEWVSLGTLQFGGTPSITLANNTAQYSDTWLKNALSGVDDIAWDAVAFVPLDQKPTDFVVALGDSFSSGEGTSDWDGSGFYRGSDHNGAQVTLPNGDKRDGQDRNACHRSSNGWPNWINVPSGIPGAANIGALAQAKDPRVDFQLLACSGAQTKNIVKSTTAGAEQQFGELTQLDRGFLDANTTVVTLTVGGNDVGFSPILNTCINGSIGPTTIPDCKDMAAPSKEYNGTLGEMVDARIGQLAAKVKTVLAQVHDAAPNARVIMLGYPMLFESASSCVLVPDWNRTWLNDVSARLDSTLTRAAAEAGSYVSYQNPNYLFTGSNLCAAAPAINGLILATTPGDTPGGASAQSVHPNMKGKELYSFVANDTMRNQRIDLTSSLTGGAATTYYSTFRIHTSGPASMNVSSFTACGNEIRFGLRKNDATNSGVFGQQHTNTLGWTSTHKTQMFESTAGGNILPSGWYALNGRLTSGCPGGATQTWQAQLYL